MPDAILKIEGMTCGHCVGSVTQALEALAGVNAVSVQLESNAARVSFDAGKLGLPEMKKAVEAAGYVVTGTESST